MNNDIVSGFDDERNDSVRLRLQKIEELEGGLIVYATGYVDTYNALFFQRRVEKAIKAGFVQIVFELSGTSYVSSTGQGVFVSCLRQLTPRKGDMVLCHVQPPVYEVFQLLGFAQFFTFKDNLTESIDYLAMHRESPLFPRVFKCPICSKRLQASKSGRFRCVECKTILVLDEATRVLLG
jgi:anti-anti-sigma factor